MNPLTEKLRAAFFVIMAASAVCLGAYRLMKIQLVEGEDYLHKAQTSSKSTQIVKAPRGEIVDYNNTPLVSNKSCYNVIVDKAFFPSDNAERSRIILETANLLENEGASWYDVLPISSELPFEFDSLREDDIAEMRGMIGVQKYATPEQCIHAMCSNYGIPDDYSDAEKRRIAGIRFTMEKRCFSLSNTYTFAEDISMDSVIKLKELSYRLDGIDIAEDAVRIYGNGDVIPHLIGTVGAIDADEYAELKAKGYALDDNVGKSGIELAMESSLRGKKGTRTIEMLNGTVISDKITDETVPGNTIRLTVDSNYQRKIQTILENHIYWLRHQTSDKAEGTEANAGAIVVLNAKTGALLAAATSPTYDLNDYISNYSAVLNGANKPLINRAVSGTYRPGSTFKTVTATAALNEGIITPNTYITCNHIYDYWKDYQPACTGWHGSINVVTALEKSCNIFFYECGRQTGVDMINDYASMYGLGGDMGLEIGRGIKKGYIASPYVFDRLGLDWQAGNIVQMAIGQSETAVTPLQMAAQAMTIANKGIRYRTYMVDSIFNYNMDATISVTKPQIAAVIEDKTGYTFDTVKKGMIAAANFTEYSYPTNKDYYTESYLLTDLPAQAAIKTGTPQMTSSEDTGSAFIGFYPADDPEIAFSGFIEHGEFSKFMVKEIISAYIDKGYSIIRLGSTEDIPDFDKLNPPEPEEPEWTLPQTVTTPEPQTEYYDYDYEDHDYSEYEEYYEPETETEPPHTSPPETATETEPPRETETETQTETEPPRETEPETQTEAEPPPDTEPETQPETELPPETETETQPETEPPRETETELQPETEPPRETEPEPQAETESEPEPAEDF